MAYTRSLIILANSYKLQARCIAGKSLRSGVPTEWIRPVNPANHGGAVSEREIQGPDGKGPMLLDIVNISFDGKSGHHYQPENHSINTACYWDKIARANQDLLQSCVDNVSGALWINDSSSFNGINDQIPQEIVTSIHDSLKFVIVDNLNISVVTGWEGGRNKIRGLFTLAGYHYNLGVTDPDVHSYYMSQGLGFYRFGPCYLCISVGELFNGFAYKLIAGVIKA